MQFFVDMRPIVMYCMGCILLTSYFAWPLNVFWLWLIVFEPMICLNDVFLRKAVIGVALNTFPNLLLISNICQCLLINFVEFGKIGLYVTKNGITIFRTTLVLFNRVDLSGLSTFSIWFQMMLSLYSFFTNRFTKSFECFLYLKVE